MINLVILNFFLATYSESFQRYFMIFTHLNGVYYCYWQTNAMRTFFRNTVIMKTCIYVAVIWFYFNFYFNNLSSSIKKDIYLVLSKHLVYPFIFGRIIHNGSREYSKSFLPNETLLAFFILTIFTFHIN